jgi:hypothetical protein
MHPPPACTPMRTHCTVVIDLGIEIFARSGATGKIRSSNGRGSRTFGKTAEALENLGMSGGMFNTPKYCAVLGLVFCTTESLFPFKSI